MQASVAVDMLAHDTITVHDLEQRRKDRERSIDDLMNALNPAMHRPPHLTRANRV